jgi:hypothetical protein
LTGLAVMLLAGCGSSGSAGTGSSGTGTGGGATLTTLGSTSGTTTASLPSYASATAERAKLLALAKPGTTLSSTGTVPGWPPANGSGIPATPSEVSGFGFVPDKAKNIQYLSFAVADSGGRCAAGDLEANAAGTQITSAKPVTLPSKAPCTGDEAAKIAGHG